MKRFISLFLVCILMLSITVAYAADYSSMTDAELKSQFEAIRNELVVRGLKVEGKTVILDKAGVQIYINGSPKVDKTWMGLYLYIPIVIVNNSNYNITVTMDDASVNGWSVGSFNASIDSNEVASGKKAKANIQFELEDTDVETTKDFEDAEFTLMIYNKDDWFGKKVVDKTKPITIYAPVE